MKRIRRTLAGLALAAGVLLPGGCPFVTTPGGSTPTPNQTDMGREIEEADIVKEADGLFYIANPYKGLRIIDATDMTAPRLLGSLPTTGRGVELFVRDGVALLFTSADLFLCAGTPVGAQADTYEQIISPDYDASRLWVIDVSDPTDPQLLDTLDLPGFMTGTRRVGDVVYIAGNIPGEADTPAEPNAPPMLPPSAGVFVTSVDISDPSQASEVQTLTFDGASLDVHVTQEAMYVLGEDPDMAGTTRVTYVDISDPAGQMQVRSQFRVPGVVRNRFFADEYQDTFRIVTEETVEPQFTLSVALYTYDVSDPDHIRRLARLPITDGEQLTSVRFDGVRGYAVTFFAFDPLFVLDLSDPANPEVTGQLEVPGFSTHLVPLEDRLVAVGFDNRAGLRPAVALYDVADIRHPRQLDRVVIGERGTYDNISEATVDEKAFKVVQEANLILLPVSSFNEASGRYDDFLQLIDFRKDTLAERGILEHPGLVRRAGLRDQKLWVLSDLAFQTAAIDDLDQPESLATIEFIDEQELLDSGLIDCVQQARQRGQQVAFQAATFDTFGTFPCFFAPLLTFAGLAAAIALRRRVRTACDASAGGRPD